MKIIKQKNIAKISKQNIKKHIYTLASDKLEGRLVGSKGNQKAIKYIVDEFKKDGLKPGGDNNAYLHEFKAKVKNHNWSEPYIKVDTANVVGILEGWDPEHKNEYIIVGAHLDHVGKIGDKYGQGQYGGSVNGDNIFNGADDNASGIAGLLELAKTFSKYKTKRSIIFVAFNGEEQGLLGSKEFIKNEIKSFPNIKYVINIDMIGRNSNRKMAAYYEGPPQLETAIHETEKNSKRGLKAVKGKDSVFFPYSDHYPFYLKGYPVVFYNTGMHKDLHRVTDNPDKINYDAATKATQDIAQLLQILADAKENSLLQKQSTKTKKIA